MTSDSLIWKLRAIKPSSSSPELSEHAYAQAVEDCIAIIMEESGESEIVTTCNGQTESDGPRSLPSPSPANHIEQPLEMVSSEISDNQREWKLRNRLAELLDSYTAQEEYDPQGNLPTLNRMMDAIRAYNKPVSSNHEVLQWIKESAETIVYHYPNPELNHVDFRVRATKIAEEIVDAAAKALEAVCKS